MRIKLFNLVSLCYFAIQSPLYADSVSHKFQYPFYLGLTGGYGWTTWEGLVPPEKKQSIAMAMSTPVFVSEGGGLWGAFAGYEFLPYFALEAAYLHYPDAKVRFDEDSIFSFDHEDRIELITKTETISLMAKIMMMIPLTDIRIYSSLGGAEVHRCDEINDHWTFSPTFGAGLNYNFTNHIMAELGVNYTAGKGQSELNPVDDYFPFVYSVFLRLGYRF